MFKILVLFALSALCQADLPTTPPPVRCEGPPDNIFKCIGSPTVLPKDISLQCSSKTHKCDRMRCIFEKSNWMKGDEVDKAKVIAAFEQFAKDHPAWRQAVEQVKTNCLTEGLPTQDVYLNCRQHDIMHCALRMFLWNAQPSQWSTAAECNYPRQFAAVCPLCSEDCFAPAIPYGSCNSCRLLPRESKTP